MTLLIDREFFIAGFSDKFESSSDPVWRRTFFLYVQDKANQTLDVVVEIVKDSDDEDNVELGRVTVDNLAELCDGEIHDLSLSLQRLEQAVSTN